MRISCFAEQPTWPVKNITFLLQDMILSFVSPYMCAYDFDKLYSHVNIFIQILNKDA